MYVTEVTLNPTLNKASGLCLCTYILTGNLQYSVFSSAFGICFSYIARSQGNFLIWPEVVEQYVERQ